MENKKFDFDFEEYKKSNPNWEKYLTDSTYYELMDWYDSKYGLCCEEHNSDEARDFADYIWDKLHDYDLPDMSVYHQLHGGYELVNMSEEDLRSLHTMINGSCLPERQRWNSIKQSIEKLLNTK